MWENSQGRCGSHAQRFLSAHGPSRQHSRPPHYRSPARAPVDLGYFETEHHTQLIRDLRASIAGGRLIALTAVIGSGKTLLVTTLFYDLSAEKVVTFPGHTERPANCRHLKADIRRPSTHHPKPLCRPSPNFATEPVTLGSV